MSPSTLMTGGAAAMVVALVLFILGAACWVDEPSRSQQAYQEFRSQCEDDGYTRTDCDLMWARLQGRGCP